MSLFQALPSLDAICWCSARTPFVLSLPGTQQFFFFPGTASLNRLFQGSFSFSCGKRASLEEVGREPIQQKRDEFPSQRRAPVQTDGGLLLSLARVSAHLEICRTLPGKSEQPLALRRQIKVGQCVG